MGGVAAVHEAPNKWELLKAQVASSQVFHSKLEETCKGAPADQTQQCEEAATNALFCKLLQRSHPEGMSESGCSGSKPASFMQVAQHKAPEDDLAL